MAISRIDWTSYNWSESKSADRAVWGICGNKAREIYVLLALDLFGAPAICVVIRGCLEFYVVRYSFMCVSLTCTKWVKIANGLSQKRI